MDILKRLHENTYVVEHNPNCPKRFLVRLCGEIGYIDKKPYFNGETKDALGFGKTLREAAKKAFAMQKKLKAEMLKKK